MPRKDWSLYMPWSQHDPPGSRRDDGSLVTVYDFLHKAPMRQVFLYLQHDFCEDNWMLTNVRAHSITYAMDKCRRLYIARN